MARTPRSICSQLPDADLKVENSEEHIHVDLTWFSILKSHSLRLITLVSILTVLVLVRYNTLCSMLSEYYYSVLAWSISTHYLGSLL